ncbi:hypothetical protein KAI04_04775 [Candidatus Pacearchaeota archaeon]|nr:hypothetical protein [Candidatus Pacearchaeota archaeon]
MTSGIWSVGSVVEQVSKLVGPTNVPTTISGTDMNSIVEQEINFVELFTSDIIVSSAIPEKYQPAIIDLTQSKILLAIDSNTGGIDNIKLGDLSVKSNNSSSDAELAKQLRVDAITRLKELSRTTRFKRVIGC